MSETLKPSCIVCDEALEQVPFAKSNQPYDGMAFGSGGHYGTTVFDPMDGTSLEVNVCDKCILKARDKGQVVYYCGDGNPRLWTKMETKRDEKYPPLKELK